ncbi:DUF1653 domain-containing protein [Candidatus Dojkabacteria bacterium]|uniref:DUF1653 domain-containing protein n=1 Tax=Candidatus Dojkabacteria bacterium TaxID=2099670 RepID=A0A955RKY8_9BACT|nr:DUF1653 domain-containing protein [Candidatus Dojkabacteria bacterium]
MKIQPGIYKHYSGNEYKVLRIVKHSETLEDMVLYEALYNNNLGKFWVRPYDMFTESLEVDGETKPRFEFVRDY